MLIKKVDTRRRCLGKRHVLTKTDIDCELPSYALHEQIITCMYMYISAVTSKLFRTHQSDTVP